MFKTTELQVRDLEKNEAIELVFEYDGSLDDIVHWQPGCGCTADIKKDPERNALVATFTENVSQNVLPEHYKTHFPSGKIEYRKSIAVFLLDDQDLYIQNGMDTKYNDKKKNVNLFFSGKVKLY